MIARAEFDAYNAAVEEIAVGAEVDVRDAVLAWCRENPDATVAEKREVAKLIMEGVVQSYDEAAAALAAEWYDHRAEAEGARLEKAITTTVYDPDSVDRVARYQAGKLAGGDDAGFADACGEFARNDAMRSLNDTVVANAGRDKGRGVRFARIPTGSETCTFCIMLASRGAVYHTREKAGEFKHYHRRCDCKVVPGFEDDPLAILVEGIDPKRLYKQYKLFEQVDSMEGVSAADKDEIKARAMIVDIDSLMAKKIGAVKYTKPRSMLEEHEKAGVDYLMFNGFDVETIIEDPDARANLDISMNGGLWEMKNLTNAKSSVSNQVKRARVKWFKLGIRTPMTSVFTSEGNKDGFDETCAALEERRRSGETFIAISPKGVVRILWDK